MNNENATRLLDTLTHLSLLGHDLDQKREEQIVSAILLELGLPTKQPGFDYLQHAVPLYRANPTQLITKELYPKVAGLYHGRTNVQQVERAIRMAIDYAYKNGDPSAWQLYYPAAKEERPSNAEFISRLARLVDLWECMNR